MERGYTIIMTESQFIKIEAREDIKPAVVKGYQVVQLI